MEKLFSAKVLTPNEGLKPLTIGGIGFIIAFFCMLYEALRQYAVYIFSVVFAGTIITIFVSKGDIDEYNFKKELFIFNNHLEIGGLIFPFSEIANLAFKFQGFQGMKLGSYQPDPDVNFKRSIEYGIDNTISFRYKKQSFDYRFHVQSQQHFYQFVQMLEQLYAGRAVFEESNQYGKTFLMQNVTEEQYAKMLQAYA